MKWFKHFTDAHDNNDLTKVRMKYGADGYAIYWYCLELIAGDLGESSITFELRHDAEVIGFNLKIDTLKVEDIMKFMITLGLFEKADNQITCLKLAKYLDKKTTRNNTIHEIIDYAASAIVPDCPGLSGIVPDKQPVVPDKSGRSGLDTDTEKKDQEIPPPIPEKPKRAKATEIKITAYLEKCLKEGVLPLPEDDPAFAYASTVGIPSEFLELCWGEFVDRNIESGKRYRNWKQAFSNCIRGNWYKLWWLNGNDYQLTTTGQQAQRKHKAAA